MENEHELSYETLTRVYLGSYEHYKGVGAEVEHSKPGFELQGSKMDHMGAKDCCLMGLRKKRCGASCNEGCMPLFIVKKLEKNVKTNKSRRRARIVILEDEDAKEDSSKQGRKIYEIDKDPTTPLVQPEQDMEYDFDVSTTEGFTTSSVPITTAKLEISTTNILVSTAGAVVTTVSASISIVSPPSVSTAEDISGAETLFNEEERQRLERQEEEKYDLEKAVELQKQLDEKEEVVAKVNQAHDIDWSDPVVLRYHAVHNRSFSIAEVRKNIIDVINEILEEDFDSLLDEGSKILYFIKGTPLEDKIFAEFDEFIAMNIKENTEPKINEKIAFEKITFDTDYKIKKTLEPPTDLELKPFHDHLEYAFLEEPSFLPVIISSQLSEQNKDKLIFVLKRHKQTFA
ncbi:hypothetical protein Tco_1329401 [Tanacetum coccineum]